ncbi:hypothetical protein LshimejAT787_0500580 [Lyophyllum shimeji]|uniref:Uncharacterized protein n=1 Tax=Lyophyllum shimeji TaxID=47721 RepID=A0A9P3PMJ2_LYOSH|nr:hypothetical protein LshimejAT787_0500580 [Lyophyllum shimeji]
MAQVQTARFPTNRPLWDEEVVPALRKRLESESRTLAKRMSAVSLSSQDDHSVSMHVDPLSASTYTNAPASPFLQSNASASARSRYDQADTRASSDRIIPTAGAPALNGHAATPIKQKPPSPVTFQRSRTYSQPYLADLPNGTTQRPKTNSSTKSNGVSKSPRLPDSRPTRIPQPASRSPASASVTASASAQGHTTIPNGYHQYNSTSPQDPYGRPSLSSESSSRTPITIPRAHLNTPNVNVGLGLLDEPPPFNPASASSSLTPSHYSARDHDDAPARPSVDSEERPFEHWYRGEVSRNGGVGELRVARREEMLRIANYGHTLRAKEKEKREAGMRRKRADSLSGAMGIRERERGSLYLNEEDATGVGRVMDEAPLTDFESDGGHYDDLLASYEDPQEEEEDQFEEGVDVSNVTSTSTASPPEPRPSNDTRSITPTQSTMQQAPQRPSSRTATATPSRIPARSRQSSESRATTPTPMLRGASEPSTPSASTSKSVSPPSTRQRQQSKPTPNGRATSKPRTPAGKAGKVTKAKTVASKKELEEEAKRRSVASYPTPGGEDGDETMIDAIPEWTQPVPRQGNWDEVVLPVVARKKGLDEHYEKADGKPTPRKVENTIAPAPGTFGFDHSKYRPPRADGEGETIPMDEFGRPTPQRQPASPRPEEPAPTARETNTKPTAHDEMRIPSRAGAPSPLPFSDYAPVQGGEKAPGLLNQQDLQEEKDEGGGCCKCIIM